MITFSMEILSLVADFLASEPIIYLWGMIIFLFIVKAFMMIVRTSSS